MGQPPNTGQDAQEQRGSTRARIRKTRAANGSARSAETVDSLLAQIAHAVKTLPWEVDEYGKVRCVALEGQGIQPAVEWGPLAMTAAAGPLAEQTVLTDIDAYWHMLNRIDDPRFDGVERNLNRSDQKGTDGADAAERRAFRIGEAFQAELDDVICNAAQWNRDAAEELRHAEDDAKSPLRPRLLLAISSKHNRIEDRYDEDHPIPLREAAEGARIRKIIECAKEEQKIDWAAEPGGIPLRPDWNTETTENAVTEAVNNALDEIRKTAPDRAAGGDAKAAVEYWMTAIWRMGEAEAWMAEAKEACRNRNFLQAHEHYGRAVQNASAANGPERYAPAHVPGQRPQKAGLLVRATQCATCIYRAYGGNDIARLEGQIKAPTGGFNSYRVCHSHTLTAPCCRGFWDRHKDEFPAGQVAQRFNLVIEVATDNDAYEAGNPSQEPGDQQTGTNRSQGRR